MLMLPSIVPPAFGRGKHKPVAHVCHCTNLIGQLPSNKDREQYMIRMR